jgi:glucose/mannose transport system permease protein
MVVVVLILLGHVSLKSFDLVYAMVGQGPGFATDVPGIFVFEQTFRALKYNTGAAASVVMLLLVAAVMVPYLYRSTKGARS